MKSKHKIAIFAIFFIGFLGGILFFGSLYFKFGLLFEDLLIILTLPLVGTNKAVIEVVLKDSLIYVLFPSIFCAIFITFLPNILNNRYIKICLTNVKK